MLAQEENKYKDDVLISENVHKLKGLTLVYRRGWLPYHPPHGFSRPAKTFVYAKKWLHVIVGSSFALISANKILPPYLGVGVWGRGGISCQT